MKKFKIFSVSIILFALFVAGCGGDKKHAKIGVNDEILAFGDSLTFGYGASETSKSYPAVLAKITGKKVINAGTNGDTSSDGARKIASAITPNTRLVILSLGGNDFLRGENEAVVKQNLISIIDEIKARGADVVLVGVPSINFGATLGIVRDNRLYSEIAREKGVLLFSGKWSEILSKNRYKSDQIHANDAGYEKFAQDLAEFLRENGIL